MKLTEYHPEQYWSEVGKRIESRENENFYAGDDEPFYRYKRKKFLSMLNSIDCEGRSILEVGSGPGGNLQFIYQHKNPKRLSGIDISDVMINLARKNLNNENIEVFKTDGRTLPFKDDEYDIVFTSTVLQHNTDKEMLGDLINEISRVSKEEVYLFERIEPRIMGDELNYGRPVKYYSDLFKKNRFELVQSDFINIRISYYVCGAIRKLLNPRTRKEGEPLNNISTVLQSGSILLTQHLDKIFTSTRGLGKLRFRSRK